MDGKDIALARVVTAARVAWLEVPKSYWKDRHLMPLWEALLKLYAIEDAEYARKRSE